MRLVGALVFLLLASSLKAAVYPLPVPDWVMPTMEAAPPHSLEKMALALWVWGWPCPDFDNLFAPSSSLRPSPPYTPPIYGGAGDGPCGPSAPVPGPRHGF